MGAPTGSTKLAPNAKGDGSKLPSSSTSDGGVGSNSANNHNSCSTYLSLVQQYLAVFQVDNALWLIERCVAEYPECAEATYLQALCYYRMGQAKNARACLDRHSQQQSLPTMTTTAVPPPTTLSSRTGIHNIHTINSSGIGTSSSSSSQSSQQQSQSWTNSMLFLSAQCSYDLGDYSRGETTLTRPLRIAYKQHTRDILQFAVSSSSEPVPSMQDWILQTRPCPVPNGAAGLALLAKICKKSNRKDQAIHFFRMSLQLDPFLFTSFQALAELGVVDLDATAIFGGGGGSSSAALATQIHPPPHTNNNNKTTTVVKTPLQPMELLAVSTAARNNDNRGAAHFIDTPGLTPIPYNNQNHSTPVPLSMGLSSTTAATAPGTSQQPSIVRRARHIASRQHYPPTIHDTPLTSVTRSMRYLRGLGTHDVGRSLFLASLENHHAAPNSNSEAPIPPATTNVQTLVTTTNATAEGVSCAKADKESNEVVQDILDLLTIAGAAYLHLCQYRCQEALHLFQQLSFSQQQTAWVLNQQGRAFLEKGDFLAAQRCLECMHAVDPGRMQGLELLSTVYWQLKKEIDLANLAQRAMDWDFSSPQAFCVAGNCFSLQKDHENALVFFKRSLQLDPHFTYTHTLAGYEYMSNEDFDKAFACFRKAIQLDDRHYNAWYGLGAVYHRQEKYDLAEYHFDRAVSIHPTSSVLRCNLGMAQNANGKAYVALETLSEAFRLDPRNPQARFQRATIYSALHRPEEALAELKIVRDAAPREATVHFAMGKVLKRLGRPDEAMKCFLTAMDLDPKDNQLIKSAMDKLDEPDADEESTTNY